MSFEPTDDAAARGRLSGELIGRLEVVNAGATYHLEGELDVSASGSFRRRARALLTEISGDLRVNVRDLVFIDSSGLRAVLDAQVMFQAEGRRLRLVNVVGQPRRFLSLVELLDLIDETREQTPA